MKIVKKGPAMRVIFFYPGEEGTYVDHADVTLYENGIVHIESNQEETTTHLQNCEILWRFETEGEDRSNKVRLLKPKTESQVHGAHAHPFPSREKTADEVSQKVADTGRDLKADTKTKVASPKNSELIDS